MTVHKIPKADTYGTDMTNWQIHRDFRIKVEAQISKDVVTSEEDIEEVILSLHRLGCVILSG